MMYKNYFDYLVVGGGIVGISTALHLKKKAKTTALIERTPRCKETSFGNSGIIESSYILPFAFPKVSEIGSILLNQSNKVIVEKDYIRQNFKQLLSYYRHSSFEKRQFSGRSMRPLIKNAVEEYLALINLSSTPEKGRRFLKETGRIKLYRNERDFLSDKFERELATELGVSYDVLSPNDLFTLEPALKRNDAVFCAVSWTDSARLTNPGMMVDFFKTTFTERGGQFILSNLCEIVFESHTQHWLLKDNMDQTYRTKHLILSAGPWTNELLQLIKQKNPYQIPMIDKRGYHQSFSLMKQKGNKDAKLNHALVDGANGCLMIGTEEEKDGKIYPCIRLTTGVHLCPKDHKINQTQIESAYHYASDFLELEKKPFNDIWYGTRPCTPDSLPVIGAVKDLPNLWVNAGHGHSGISIAPSSARLLTQIITNEKTFCDPQPYATNRFD